MILELAHLHYSEDIVRRHQEDIRKEAALQRTLRLLRDHTEKEHSGIAAKLIHKLQETWLISTARVEIANAP